MNQAASNASQTTVDAQVIDSEVVDEGLLRRLLQRAGRSIAGPAIEAWSDARRARQPR